MLELPNVTLLSVNCVDHRQSALAIKYSQRGIKFGKSILISSQCIATASPPEFQIVDIKHLGSWHGYNDFMLGIGRYVATDYALIIQDDGFVTNPDMWDPAFLEYDYIGAPWPAEPSWVDKQVLGGEIRGVFPYNRVGNGGFSLRSRKFMEVSSEFDTCGGLGEDAFLCTHKYSYMLEKGIKFAPMDLAYKFSYENPLLDYGHKWNDSVALNPDEHFGFHGHQFSNSQQIINLKGI